MSRASDFVKNGYLRGRRERLDIRSLVERVVEHQNHLGHAVTLEAGTPITVEGVPPALRRMVVNVIDVALKYVAHVRLRLRDAFDYCVLEIDDAGPEMSEQLQRQAFEPLSCVNAFLGGGSENIDCRLATVHAIAHDHGGAITVGHCKSGALRVTILLRLERS
jgi:K+-sensing histidine kinase KdpD